LKWPFCPRARCRTTCGTTASLSSLSQTHAMPRGYSHRQAGHVRCWPHKSVIVAGWIH
jgi:hypothetical protein